MRREDVRVDGHASHDFEGDLGGAECVCYCFNIVDEGIHTGFENEIEAATVGDRS